MMQVAAILYQTAATGPQEAGILTEGNTFCLTVWAKKKKKTPGTLSNRSC